MSLGCGCPEIRYASPVCCDDHEARRAAAWAQIDARLADRFLDVMLLATELNAAPGAVHRFVKIRRSLLELAGQPTLPDDALAPHLIEREEAPKRIGRGAPCQIPAVLLAKLALDQRLQGSGLGSELLVKALLTILDAARAAGGKLVVVDAVDETAAAFYRHHNFEPIPGNPHRLVMKLSTAAEANQA